MCVGVINHPQIAPQRFEMGEGGERDGRERKSITSDEFQIDLGVRIRCLIGGFRSDGGETHEGIAGVAPRRTYLGSLRCGPLGAGFEIAHAREIRPVRAL